MDIPTDIYQEILEQTDFLTQIRLTQLCKHFYNNLKIYDFYTINYKYLNLLSDDILKNYKYIRKLDAFDNPRITDEGIKHLSLHTLYAAVPNKYMDNPTITDTGISHMTNLYALYAGKNSKITDAGISNMRNLKILDASWNDTITNEGIKNMNLSKLNAVGNYKISINGVKHMPDLMKYKHTVRQIWNRKQHLIDFEKYKNTLIQ